MTSDLFEGFMNCLKVKMLGIHINDIFDVKVLETIQN